MSRASAEALRFGNLAAALANIALPDAATFEAMRSVHGAVPQVGAAAGPWIHLLALTLLLSWLQVVVALAGAFLIVNQRAAREA